MRRLLILITLVIAQSIPTVAESREKELDHWVSRDLIPYVRQQLLVHPRFKNETVMFVILRDNVPASISNELALSLRDQLLESAIDSAGVSIGWQQGRSGASLASRPDDCSRDNVHYYIGLELSQDLDSRYSVNVRALDLEDRTWVTGFGRQWQGRLSTVQRQAMRQRRVDDTFLGARDVPFTTSQTDLLAANLAHKLSCTLKQSMHGDYVVTTASRSVDDGILARTVELVGNNLASHQALKVTRDESKTNAKLVGKAHHIDASLYQYWLTITPEPGSESLTALSVSAYVVLPGANNDTAVVKQATLRNERSGNIASDTRGAADRRVISIPNAGKDGLIGPLTIAAPQSGADCLGPCSLLTARANADGIVFFLEHQAHHGLVRLSGSDCRKRTVARLVRAGDRFQFPIARTSNRPDNWRETFDWKLQADTDTYFAVVANESDFARRLANHIDKLPQRCSSSIRPGLTGDALREWLTEFAMITARGAEQIDWRGIEVNDIT